MVSQHRAEVLRTRNAICRIILVIVRIQPEKEVYDETTPLTVCLLTALRPIADRTLQESYRYNKCKETVD
ncbi:hypothetical protein RRG08_043654 [Elysia crispata]|uniref:Uncharacterized protein n=1 Tax=Elysia crispata TaxID=231223 RepID=A0AAE0ZUW1_9GAST|nr:hypothetical protein RRG08_043654 [Elysia crispata]